MFLFLTQRTPVDINDLESLGELGHGTCGQVIKMRHRPSGHLMAVKVCSLRLKYETQMDNPIHLRNWTCKCPTESRLPLEARQTCNPLSVMGSPRLSSMDKSDQTVLAFAHRYISDGIGLWRS